MRRRNRMGYRGYQGRGGGASTFLKLIVCILAILVVGGGGYLLALNNGGALPSWLPQGQTTDTPQTPASDTPTQEPDPSDSPQPSPTPSQAPETEEIRAVDVTVSQLLDGSAQTLAQQTGCDAVVVEVKGEGGKLQWPSQAALARQLGTVSTTQSLTQALSALSAQDIYLVARVDCFRDQALAAANVGGSLLMTRSGNRWYDFMGMSWVSPVNTQVRQYLVELCVELSEMGFDELVLDSAYFPDQGEVHVLAQSTNYPQTRATVVEQFWQEVTQALEGSQVRLSAQVRGDSLVEGGVTSGMTPQLLAQYTQRVWVTLNKATTQTQVTRALTQAGMDPSRQLVVQEAASGQTIWE